ncbi:MAG: PilZ domain-containing protein [Deltaproteobacteria bacterium]|nr:PilZ domain-containing protein [Deltaproteobacteria bacterium]MBW2309050.1 PilZ domain-containing protein [Deltaproteobacteria bacterium]
MKDNTYDGTQKRDHFRVTYPYTERPKLTITGEGFDIIDISEKGIKFSLDTTLRATISFHDGESLHVEGKIIRIRNNEIVVHLSKDIPPERISTEQRYLMNKYVGYR